jgi:hypothetical protein
MILLLIAMMAGWAAVAQGLPRREFPMAAIGSQCLDFTEVRRGELRDCRVSESGEFGAADGETYHYALYCLVPNDAPDRGRCNDGSFNADYHRQRGLAVFVREARSGNARLLFERVDGEVGLMRYEKPRIIRAAAGTLLYLPIAYDGTGHLNGSEYFLRANGGWEPIEAETWTKDLLARIPAGLEMRMGVWPDLETMKAETGLYRPGDPNCCPSGGVARIRLAILGKRFVIESFVAERAR